MDYFKELEEELKKYLEPAQIYLIKQAYSFAEIAHRDQYRMTGEPYIIHPVKASLILAEMRMDQNTVIATLLHDVLEDTNYSKSFLVDNFSQEIADLVDGVSKLKQIRFNSKAEAQAENLRKMILAMVKDIRVILVKLADRLHNIRTLGSLPIKKQKRIARETLEIYAPIANRLGIHKIYIELEDLCFKALYPMRYRALKSASQEIAIANKEMLEMIKDTIVKSLIKNEINDFKIFSRKKHLYSTYKKMLSKGSNFRDIMDMYGIRLVVKNKDLCYRVLGIIHSLYKPISKGFKDYIAIPKINSYQSLHTILFGPFGIPIEVQIRTQEMHKVAEIGIAAHWMYKSMEQSNDPQSFLALGWIKELAEMEGNATSSLDFIESVKVELFPDEVYVFTPEGDIVKLPQNATPVDFAY
ncbi:MAG: bifunctional (p)ppGpp synthetase/guanosine-3',5'-bis(diphosphate) 3'-pyrophosphohydrolase, partial [Legionellales bacterium]|nr:bifunctional (p)ppGpp synthetase/guanosine-3',5'-bis(diphosphate) 3'-pyrophosphohydrolase [Legionellales bacterium]